MKIIYNKKGEEVICNHKIDAYEACKSGEYFEDNPVGKATKEAPSKKEPVVEKQKIDDSNEKKPFNAFNQK